MQQKKLYSESESKRSRVTVYTHVRLDSRETFTVSTMPGEQPCAPVIPRRSVRPPAHLVLAFNLSPTADRLTALIHRHKTPIDSATSATRLQTAVC
jgi:hypothetical protein